MKDSGGIVTVLVVAGATSVACGSSDDRPVPEASFFMGGGIGGGAQVIIPTDERPALRAAEPPVPVSGGTLHVTADGTRAIVADPSRDQVAVVALAPSFALEHTIALEQGDEPGRIAEGPPGRIHVALRRAGQVVSVDPVVGAVIERRDVCRAPRGVAYDAEANAIHVACAEGKLVTLGAEGGGALRSLDLEMDLRDVIVQGSEIWVTRFKSAELLRLSAEGEILGRSMPLSLESHVSRIIDHGDGLMEGTLEPVSLMPAVAWRAVESSEGGAVIVHQEEMIDEVDLEDPEVAGQSAYGSGSSDCSGIVRNSVTLVGPDGAVVTTVALAGGPLPVDVAVSPDRVFTAIAHAGVRDVTAPQPSVVQGSSGGPAFVGAAGGANFMGPVSIFSDDAWFDSGCAFPNARVAVDPEPAVAVRFTPANELLALMADSSRLLVMNAVTGAVTRTIVLSTESRIDTGHELFHRDAGAGIACASCHPEGGEDGHVWRFSGIGDRRTQALYVGLEGTAPFHWDGDLEDIGALMKEVFVGRMGGVKQSLERLGALEDWLFGIVPPPAIRDVDEDAVLRGEALFQSASVGCSSCHAGDRFTDSRTVSVGTLPDGGRLQVPSLVAIGYRAPFMHNGCAQTLADRFQAWCGGTEHGATAGLSQSEIGDLISYLESL